MNEDKGTRYRRVERGLRVIEVAMASLTLGAFTLSPLPPVLRDAATRMLVTAGVAPGALRAAGVAATVLAVSLVLPALAAMPFAVRRLGPIALRFGAPPTPARALVRSRLRRGVALVAAGSVGWVAFASVSATWPRIAGVLTLLAGLGITGLVMLAAPWLIAWSPRVRPLRDEAITGRLHALASRAQIRLAGLHEWAFGPEGDHANAALVGVIGPRRLLLSDTLIEGCTADEVDAVVAHELGHHVHGHTWRRVRGQATGVLLAGLAAHAAAAGPARWMGGTGGATDAASIPWMLCGAGLVWLALRPWRLAQSRAHEAEADAFALELTGRPDVLERVLARLGARNLTSDDESLLTRAFFLTHPPIPARIAAARRAAQRTGAQQQA